MRRPKTIIKQWMKERDYELEEHFDRFMSVKEWNELGYFYMDPKTCAGVLTHEGTLLGEILNLDYGHYTLFDSINKAFDGSGMYMEAINGWATAFIKE